jgi:hypothetical protein
MAVLGCAWLCLAVKAFLWLTRRLLEISRPVRGLLERSYLVLLICLDLDADSTRGILPMAYLTKMADN